jgi:hypothetical protein
MLRRCPKPFGGLMSAEIILADFKSKTYHKPDPITLERMAAEIMKEVVPYEGKGIEGMWPEKDPA